MTAAQLDACMTARMELLDAEMALQNAERKIDAALQALCHLPGDRWTHDGTLLMCRSNIASEARKVNAMRRRVPKTIDEQEETK